MGSTSSKAMDSTLSKPVMDLVTNEVSDTFFQEHQTAACGHELQTSFYHPNFDFSKPCDNCKRISCTVCQDVFDFEETFRAPCMTCIVCAFCNEDILKEITDNKMTSCTLCRGVYIVSDTQCETPKAHITSMSLDNLKTARDLAFATRQTQLTKLDDELEKTKQQMVRIGEMKRKIEEQYDSNIKELDNSIEEYSSFYNSFKSATEIIKAPKPLASYLESAQKYLDSAYRIKDAVYPEITYNQAVKRIKQFRVESMQPTRFYPTLACDCLPETLTTPSACHDVKKVKLKYSTWVVEELIPSFGTEWVAIIVNEQKEMVEITASYPCNLSVPSFDGRSSYGYVKANQESLRPFKFQIDYAAMIASDNLIISGIKSNQKNPVIISISDLGFVSTPGLLKSHSCNGSRVFMKTGNIIVEDRIGKTKIDQIYHNSYLNFETVAKIYGNTLNALVPAKAADTETLIENIYSHGLMVTMTCFVHGNYVLLICDGESEKELLIQAIIDDIEAKTFYVMVASDHLLAVKQDPVNFIRLYKIEGKKIVLQASYPRHSSIKPDSIKRVYVGIGKRLMIITKTQSIVF